ncbi:MULTISPECIES: winged helix-turn-helix transcriptional regulator [unclassified Leisingera]|uniref:winged helix-turn-helix transcriptional regulator n=1 Tax=unclassified Leisingera TaxID=2614906 RepID=UPI00056BC95F|nr:MULTISPECIES: helix-turn-helix domain-containing protein [unclassified Leisingera]KIC22987.1 HxlR family transcriptional regulator [Leisingera sp. ANG-S3]KIC52433.1 HxlR family transcriptional regulator [Leisingera sp. ANG-S]KID07450.1 HxlR family transcriptional regulator [Leisingera sp. ANG1]
MLDIKPDPYAALCPSRQIIAVIGDKWSLLIIPLLLDGPMRNAELMRAIEGISQKMLTQTLKRLEDYNLVTRRDYGEVPPRVDYRLSPLGHSLAAVISSLDNWVIENFEDMTRKQSHA